MVAYRRSHNLKDELVGVKVKGNDVEKGIKKCAKLLCQICGYVDEDCTF